MSESNQNVRHCRICITQIHANNIKGQTCFCTDTRYPNSTHRQTDNQWAGTEKNQQDGTHPRQQYTDSETDIDTVQQYTATDSFHTFSTYGLSCSICTKQQEKNHSTNSSITSFPPLQHHQSPQLTNTINALITETTTVMKGERESQKCQCSDCSAITEY